MTISTDSTVLNRNVEALAARGVTLPTTTTKGPEIRLESGPAGAFMSIHTGDDRWVRMHSRHDPNAEADHLISAFFESAEPALVIVIGLGHGYVLDAIERRSSLTKVLALEPIPASLPHMLARRDWSGWLTENRLRILVGPDYSGASDAWKDFDSKASMPPIITHPVLRHEARDGVVDALAVAKRIAFGAQANVTARKQLASRYLLNTLKNLHVIAREGDVGGLFDAFKGVPAIVASAGPSLDRNIPPLLAMQDRAIVIAVDTALRPLLSAGIDPLLVVAVDPSEANARHLMDLPDPGRSWLVSEGSMDSGVFEQFEGRTFTFSVSNHHPWPWLRTLGLNRDALRAWGSVATSAFDLALKMGCEPIIFVGQDLSYTEDRPYCRGTTWEETWAAQVAAGEELPEIWARDRREKSKPLTVADINGHDVATTPQLVAFRDWITEQAALPDQRTIINATGAGILHGDRIRQSELRSVLTAFPPVQWAETRVRDCWTRTAGSAGTSRADAVLMDAFRHAISGEELTQWASFAYKTPETLSAELTEVIEALETRLKRGPENRSAAPPVVARQRVVAEPRAVVHMPERVRLIAAALFDDPVPEWVRATSEAVGFDASDTSAIQKALDGFPPSAWLGCAERCEAAGAFSHAAALYSRLADRWKQEPTAERARSASINLVKCLFLDGRFEAALTLIEGEELLSDEFCLLCLATILQFVGNHDQAVLKLEGLVAEYPNMRDLRLNLAVRLAMGGNLSDALTLVNDDSARWPGRVQSEYARGVCHRVHGDFEAATATFSRIVDQWPYATPELVVASVATGRQDAIDRALTVGRASFRNPVLFLSVPVDQATMVDEALSRLVAELASKQQHAQISRLSPVGVRLFTQARGAWKPRWQVW